MPAVIMNTIWDEVDDEEGACRPSAWWGCDSSFETEINFRLQALEPHVTLVVLGSDPTTDSSPVSPPSLVSGFRYSTVSGRNRHPEMCLQSAFRKGSRKVGLVKVRLDKSEFYIKRKSPEDALFC